jgi:hypothetical protein
VESNRLRRRHLPPVPLRLLPFQWILTVSLIYFFLNVLVLLFSTELAFVLRVVSEGKLDADMSSLAVLSSTRSSPKESLEFGTRSRKSPSADSDRVIEDGESPEFQLQWQQQQRQQMRSDSSTSSSASSATLTAVGFDG